MLGLFKKMFSKSAPPTAVPPARSTAAAPPSPRPKVALAASSPQRPALAATARPPAPKVVTMSAPARPTSPPADGSVHIQVAVASIMAGMAETLSQKITGNTRRMVPVPVDRVIPQLSLGTVTLTVAELRTYAPEIFGGLAGHDEVSVALPLGEIVQQLSPAHFARRAQKLTEVPAEVAPVFSANGGGATVSKPTAPSAPTAPAVRPQRTVTTTMVAPSEVPPAGPTSKISMSAQAMASLAGKSVAPSPGPVRPVVPAAKPTHVATPVAATVMRSPPAAQTNDAVKVSGELPVPLATISTEWAGELRALLKGKSLEQAHIHVPLALLEPAMKSGKVVFPWKEVSAWIRPALNLPSVPGTAEIKVELPLKVIAPLFMAHHRGAAQKRIAVDETIPDLFGGGNSSMQAQIAPSAPSATFRAPTPSAPAPAPAADGLRMSSPPAALAEVRTAPAAPAAPAVPDEERIIGVPGKRFSPKDIVLNASRLPGVSGALLAMNDGLLVTGHTPPSMKAENIAAFIPQMFGRMNQYTKELALGPLQQLTLTVEAGQWHVLKRDSIYFAVLGKGGEPLPLNLLAKIAAELSSQSN